MNTQPQIDRIYQRHIQAMLATGNDTWCDLGAVRFSLRLALAELAEQLAASPPETATDKLEALILSSQHITELKHALATALDERNTAEAQLAHLDEWLAAHGHTDQCNEVDRAIALIEALEEHIGNLNADSAAKLAQRSNGRPATPATPATHFTTTEARA